MIDSKIIITGVSGRFPKSENVEVFKKNLYDKVDMLSDTSERWDFEHPDVPTKMGTITEFDKFDAQYFFVNYKQASAMDVASKKLLECACEAIIDAGVNPRDLRGTKTSVFIGAAMSETEIDNIFHSERYDGYGLTGGSKAMFANRISYWLGTTAPSYQVDGNDCSGALALHHAYTAIRNGRCDAALVGCTNVSLFPQITMHLAGLSCLSKEGKTKSFSEDADGYTRSDAVVMVFLQKENVAKRAYAELVYAKAMFTEMNLKDARYHYPCGEPMTRFLHNFYGEIDVKPEEIDYVEARGLGIKKFDRQELESLASIYCTQGRKSPLLVGSVKSNIGNTESASGLCGLVKVLLGYHTGQIAPNLYLDNPLKDVDALCDGRIQLITEATPLNIGYTAINLYSGNGLNGHILLKSCDLQVSMIQQTSEIPQLICVSGRTEESIKRIFHDMESKPIDYPQVTLLRSAYQNEIPGFWERGYNIISTKRDRTVSLSKKLDFNSEIKRPVCFVYSGMGSQWTTMGAQLMKIPIFAKAVTRCHKVLEPYGIDVIKIITTDDDKIYDKIMHAFVGISAIQIGLTDLLTEIGITCDMMIGHSMGEMGCAYTDGCLTAEQMMLLSYCRGVVTYNSSLIKGSMAAVGLGYAEIKSMLPADIEVACHNSSSSCTLSGPAKPMAEFVAKLTAQGIFAKEVPCGNLAYHSSHIKPLAAQFKDIISDILKEDKLRSSRWISTSVPQSNWESDESRYFSSNYVINNVESPVLFEEGCLMIPSNAITIEIAPHGLLQAIMKRSLSLDNINISLAKRGHKNNILFLLEAIGSMYVAGLHPKVEKLYPNIQFPVPAGTSFLSHTLRWVHSESWDTKMYAKPITIFSGARNIFISKTEDQFTFMSGYNINEVNYVAPAALLVFVWETLGMILGVPHKQLSVEFRNVYFNAYIPIDNGVPELEVMVQKTSGIFEIAYNSATVVSGEIEAKNKFQNLHLSYDETPPAFYEEDIYRMLAQRGLNYRGEFRSINSTSSDFTNAKIHWKNNFITLIDGIMQLALLADEGASKPKHIARMVIDCNGQNYLNKDIAMLDASNHPLLKISRCHGIEIQYMTTTAHPKSNSTIQQYNFVPFMNNMKITVDEALASNIQTVIENIQDSLNVVEILDENIMAKSMKNQLSSIVKKLPNELCVIHVETFPENSINEWKKHIKADNMLILVSGLSGKKKLHTELLDKVPVGGFILSTETDAVNSCPENLQLISTKATTSGYQFLLRKYVTRPKPKIVQVSEDGENSWLYLAEESLRSGHDIVVVAIAENAELLGCVEHLRGSGYQNKVQLLIILDSDAPTFTLDQPSYISQIQKGLNNNVLKHGEWGSYYYMAKKTKAVPSAYSHLTISTPGDLKSLVWVQDKEKDKTGLLKLPVEVYYTRISYYDLMKAEGTTQGANEDENHFGISFSGLTARGERVMGLVNSGAAAMKLEADTDFLWPVPDYWTLEEAATVPQAYIHALYCLTQRANLQKGMKVLIMNGTGALGQAAISICLALDCEVFTTVKETRQKQLLLKIFPEFDERNICNPLEAPIQITMSRIHDRGCDIVLSSAVGIEREVLMKFVAKWGFFVDISLEKINENENLRMLYLDFERAYVPAILSNIFVTRQQKQILRKMFINGITEGWVRPTVHRTYNANEYQEAFKMIRSRQNHGVVLLRLRNHHNSIQPPDSLLTWKCFDGVYIVVCGKKNLGLEVAEKLIQLGARNLAINVHDPKMGYLQFKLRCWKKQGIKITISSDDLWEGNNYSTFISGTLKLGTIIGLFWIASAFDKNSTKSISNPNILVKNIDQITRTQCQDLQQFVVFSPLPTGIDKIFSNSKAEMVCKMRYEDGISSHNIQCLVNRASMSDAKIINASEHIESMSVSLNEALNSLPFLLCETDNPTVAVYPSTKNVNKFVSEEIVKDFGLSRNIEKYRTKMLRDIDVDLMTAKSISLTLKNNYGMQILPRRLLQMSLEELDTLNVSEENLNETTGLSMFFSKYDDNDCDNEPIFWMPTLVSQTHTFAEHYGGEDYLIVVPGMDGHRDHLQAMCRRLKLRALFCQHATNTKTSVQDLALDYTELITKRIGIGSRFFILGHSYGAKLALEMAKLLEKSGLRGKVFCVDGSHIATREILESEISEILPEDLENHFLLHMSQLMAKGCSTEILEKQIAKEENWVSKILHCLQFLRGKCSSSIEYQKTILETLWRRIVQTRVYQPDDLKLNSSIVLLRAKSSLQLKKDYGLQELSLEPVIVYELESSHSLAAYDLRIADIVNRELDEDIQLKYINSNQCIKSTIGKSSLL